MHRLKQLDKDLIAIMAKLENTDSKSVDLAKLNEVVSSFKKIKGYLPASNSNIANIIEDKNIVEAVNILNNGFIGLAEALSEEAIKPIAAAKETHKLARKTKNLAYELQAAIAVAELNALDDEPAATEFKKDIIEAAPLPTVEPAKVIRSLADLSKALDPIDKSMAQAEDTSKAINLLLKDGSVAVPHTSESAKEKQIREEKEKFPGYVADDEYFQNLDNNDSSVAALLSKTQKILGTLPSKLPDNEPFRLLRAPIWVLTTPFLNADKLKRAGVKAESLFPGWVLENQLLIAVPTSVAMDKRKHKEFYDRTTYEDILYGAMQAIKSRLKSDPIDMLEKITFQAQGKPSVSYAWLLETHIYREFGNLIIDKIGFPSSSELDKNKTRSFKDLNRESKDKIKEKLTDNEMWRKKLEEETAKKDAWDAEIAEIKEQLSEPRIKKRQMEAQLEAMRKRQSDLQTFIRGRKYSSVDEHNKMVKEAQELPLLLAKTEAAIALFIAKEITPKATRSSELARQGRELLESIRSKLRDERLKGLKK